MKTTNKFIAFKTSYGKTSCGIQVRQIGLLKLLNQWDGLIIVDQYELFDEVVVFILNDIPTIFAVILKTELLDCQERK